MPRHVVVIGGGISGLAAAWRVAECEPSAQVTVLEAGPDIGGKLRLASIAGVSVDVGAEAMLARRPEGINLVAAVGLTDSVITPLTLSAQVRAGGSNHPLPARTMLGIPGDLAALRSAGVLSPDGLARVEAEPDSQPLPPLEEDVAVGALVRSRLGDEVLDRLVEPLLGGVYAGRADELSLVATMPALAATLRREGGSLVAAAGAAVTATATATATTRPSPGAPVPPVFVSLAGGLAQLPMALASSGRFTVRTGVTVRAIRRTDVGFALDCGPVPDSVEITADAVIVATPAAKAAALLGGVAPGAAAELRGIETASMAIVTFAFNQLKLPAGSGLLVGSTERFAVKAVTLSSQKWPGTPAHLTVLRASVGRVGQVGDLQRDDRDLIALVRRDLGALLGIAATPIDVLVTRWGGGLPQYAVGHVERVARIEAAVATVPGLAVCGACYEGLGIPACVAFATRAADSVVIKAVERG
jgi:oxygen-dependent protoporphyrinogen oxidase